ncbi:hypothetical protein Tco_1192719 [Tanacetum coccineum]
MEAIRTMEEELIEDHLADRSFVSTEFIALIDITPTALDIKHTIELADGERIGADTILKVPLTIRGDRREDRYDSRLNIISCTKAKKCMQKGFYVFLAHITTKKTEKKLEEKRLEDVSIVSDFPKVFHEDLHGLLPARQHEFQIDLVLGAALVA